jgi:hypothetical protein
MSSINIIELQKLLFALVHENKLLIIILKNYIMKKLAILSMGFLFITAVIKIQASTTGSEKRNEINTENVFIVKPSVPPTSVNARNRFVEEFGNVSVVVWKNSKRFDEATFIKDGQKLTAYFDYSGNLIGTTSIKTFVDLPISGQSNIEKRYKDYNIESVIFFDYNEVNETAAFLDDTQFGGADNYFVELSKDDSKIVLQVNPDGDVKFFKKL